VAETQGLNKTGVIGTLVAAKESGLVPAVTPLLDGLRARGFHMDERLYDTARQLAGEI
jgi:predicted nucleic acid-binding protein